MVPMRDIVRQLIRGGVELYELKPEHNRQKMSMFGSRGASLHTKAFVVDGRIGFVGSFNFDARSLSLNTEMGIIFERVPDLPRRSDRSFGVKSQRPISCNYFKISLFGLKAAVAPPVYCIMSRKLA